MNKDCNVVINGFDIITRNGVRYKNVKYSYGNVIYGCVVPYSLSIPPAGCTIPLSSLTKHQVKLPSRM